jgi:hypothetical protein
LRAAGCRYDGETLALQLEPEKGKELRVVVDHQNFIVHRIPLGGEAYLTERCLQCSSREYEKGKPKVKKW